LIIPVAEIPVSELWLYKDKKAYTDLMKALKEAKENQTSELAIDEL
jgi:thiamine pyrophosphokinase